MKKSLIFIYFWSIWFGTVAAYADYQTIWPLTRGGTGVSTLTQHGVVTAGASALTTVAPGTSGNVLTSNGTDWTSSAASSTTSLSGLTANVLFDVNGNINLGLATAEHASAIDNTFVGNTAGNPSGSTTSTKFNVGIGFNALHAQTAGADEVAVGANALLKAANGITDNDDVAIGFNALDNQNGGYQNTVVGSKAATAVTTANNIVAIGYGIASTTTGSDDVYVGAGVSAGAFTASNENVFGYLAIGAGSNTVQLGNSSVTDVYLGNGTATLHGSIAASGITGILGALHGGTGTDSSASTGIARVSSGTWSYSTAVPSTTTATTQTSSDSSTSIATDAFVINAKTKAPGFSATYPATGQQCCYFVFPVSGTITGWSIVADTGTATIQTWKIAAGTAAPAVGNSISTSGVQLSSGTAIESTDVSDFTTTTVTAGDIFAFNVSALSGSPTKLTFQLKILVN